MLVKNYFFIQQLSFLLLGINIKAKNPQHILISPAFCYIHLFLATSQVVPILHYTWTHSNDFLDVTDSLSYLFQVVLALWKMIMFLSKRKKFLKVVNEIHLENFRGHNPVELSIRRSENIKDVRLSSTYFITGTVAMSVLYISPILEAIYKYLTTSELVLRLPYKTSNLVPGFSLAYILCFVSTYHALIASVSIDSLFAWIACNISAQFQIICLRFDEAAKRNSEVPSPHESRKLLSQIKSCIQSYNQTLKLVNQFSEIYGEIVFVKFIISCTQVCSLVFLINRNGQTIGEFTFQLFFLAAVIIQMILYCYNGQKVQDESLQVGLKAYLSFEWSHLPNSVKKLLLLTILRSQNASRLKGAFFVVDFRSFLWVLKTAGSLMAALKSLDENQA